MGSTGPNKPHIFAFPYPGKGHINPMLHFCNTLTSMGIKITMIHTTSTIKSLKSSPNSSINVEVIPHGYEDGEAIKDVEAYLNGFKIAASRGLSQLIDKYTQLNEPPNIVLYDSTMPWALDVTHSHGLRGASFFTQSLSVSALCYHMLEGTIKKDCDTVIVPAMPVIERKDLPDFKYVWDSEMAIQKHLLGQFSNIDKVDWILFNSFEELENEVAKWMASKWPVKTIGPTASLMYTNNKVIKTGTENNVYLFETNYESCLKWLDTKETNSVIYVSLGSIASVSKEQMAEIAQGLIKSGCEFLWVVRTEEQSKLPGDFTSQKGGLVVSWCPQLDVLAHKAVACFMTHCGWNSTLEAICLGVPMIALPQFVDQTTNAKFIADVWSTGVRAKVNEKGMVTSEEIKRCIIEIVKSENGRDMKRNAVKWKKMAKEAVEGGSSARNIQDFASSLKSIV